ncbi:hypothetical protein LM600727_31279 [Listeria monocytogenes]|nr:hypothetical protein LM600727_31279 [Listeria monocytogenes]
MPFWAFLYNQKQNVRTINNLERMNKNGKEQMGTHKVFRHL